MHTNPSPPAWLIQPITPTELYILIVLVKKPSYAYAIAQDITSSIERANTTPTTVRKALQRLAARDWLEPADTNQTGRKEQAYQLTHVGETQLKAELQRLAAILQLAEDNFIIRTHHQTHEA